MAVIQWYPGHMAKAKKQLIENLKLIDVVIELRDARIPYSSCNPDFAQLFEKKRRVVVLNKGDLANNEESKAWCSSLKQQEGHAALAIDVYNQKDVSRLISLLKRTADEIRASLPPKKIFIGQGRIIRVMIVGIPNVGKSSLINSIVKKNVAKAENRPGVTKGNQWIRILPGIELLDTPGVLWNKFSSLQTGMNLAICGAIRDDILDIGDIAGNLMEQLAGFGRIENTNPELAGFVLGQELLAAFAKKRGMLATGGVPDLNKAAPIVLKEFRAGKFGPLSLEMWSTEKATLVRYERVKEESDDPREL
ncbi:MAG: ribosome biogenesis GTPase YlqF [Clostridia bacterium]